MGEQTNFLQPLADLAASCRQLVAPFSEPVLKELGEYVAGRIRFLNFKRSLKVLEQARQMLIDKGIQPQAVNLKILVPLLEGAALEVEEDLTEKWSGLLASAASGGEVLPAFPRILSELSSDEVRLLDFMVDKSKLLEFMAGGVYGIGVKTLRLNSDLSPEEYCIRMLNLLRLGLIDLITSGPHEHGRRFYGDTDLDIVGLTRLGLSLVRACRGPAKKVATGVVAYQ